MFLTNSEKAKISFNHESKIKGLFNKHIKGELYIDHFSVNVFYGNDQSIFLSPTPQMAEELCKNNFINDDSNYKPEVYKNLSIYPWRSVQKDITDKAINMLKEEKFRMRSGMMIVRDLGEGRYVMYSFATHRRDNPDFLGQFYFLYHCKADYVAQMGDFLYDNLLPIINQYTQEIGIVMPKIEVFQPLSLEPFLLTDEQREVFEVIKNAKYIDFIKMIENKNLNFLELNYSENILKNRFKN